MAYLVGFTRSVVVVANTKKFEEGSERDGLCVGR